MAKPIIEKQKGQTDKRILRMSYKEFEDEFGFRPKDKIEQQYFAIHRVPLDEANYERYKNWLKLIEKQG